MKAKTPARAPSVAPPAKPPRVPSGHRGGGRAARAETRPGATSQRGRVPCETVLAPGLAIQPADKHILRLFVAGATTRSLQAILRVRQLCAAELKDNCELEVIDIYQQPALARENQIVATPTFIIEFPKPIRRFIGSLTNLTSLFAGLDLLPKVNLTP